MSDSVSGFQLPLAHGDLSPSDHDELQALKNQILRAAGFDCTSYKEQCLRRRIAVRLRARGLHRYSDYALLLGRDVAERRKLLDTITINVSKFYRTPDMWRVLETQVVPQLFEIRDTPVRMLSAGCAAGEEAYTLAMILREHALRTGREADLERFQLVGSDVDPRILEAAQLGRYGTFSFSDISDEVRREWFTPPAFAELKGEIRDMVRFEQHDLIRDAVDGQQHLIMCRNVMIYFERAIQEELFIKFHEALAPGGVLVLGKVETLFGRGLSLFRPLVPRERIFVKL